MREENRNLLVDNEHRYLNAWILGAGIEDLCGLKLSDIYILQVRLAKYLQICTARVLFRWASNY